MLDRVYYNISVYVCRGNRTVSTDCFSVLRLEEKFDFIGWKAQK